MVSWNLPGLDALPYNALAQSDYGTMRERAGDSNGWEDSATNQSEIESPWIANRPHVVGGEATGFGASDDGNLAGRRRAARLWRSLRETEGRTPR